MMMKPAGGSVVAVEPDESPQESGALVTVLNKIWLLTQHTDPITPILITAHRRRKLGNLCHKPGGVSVVGVISIAGAEDVATELLQLKSGINHLPAVSKVIINTS